MTDTDYHNLIEDAQLELRTADAQLSQLDTREATESAMLKSSALAHLDAAKQRIARLVLCLSLTIPSSGTSE